MSDDYVRKDIYDANLKNIELMMKRNNAETRALISEIRGEVRAWNEKFDGAVETIGAVMEDIRHQVEAQDKRISDLRDDTNKGFTRLTVIITVIQIALTIGIYFLTR